MTEAIDDVPGSGSNTPAGDADDDFFSSWDKPTIKRPSNPPSRSTTPGIGQRSASPFLNANANGNGIARSKSPLSAAGSSDSAPAPAAPRAIPSSAIRKTGAAAAPKKNILGAKKTKLGAKKVDASALDFDAAERKAQEEADRIAKLGYDPEAETPSEAQIISAQPTAAETTSVANPSPIAPRPAGGFGQTTKPREASSGEMERLGMGVRRLGFGQVLGGGAPSGSKAKTGGFGSTSRAAAAQGETDTITHLTNPSLTQARRVRAHCP